MKLYSAICWIFAVAFAAVLGMLAVVPEMLSDLMNWSGGLVGLSGDIAVAPASLEHVLALSLMATITYLAQAAARAPENRDLYWAIQTAKVISTGGFAFMAFTAGSIWFLPTATDGLVIVGLAFARFQVDTELAE